jgi:exonuclease V gamma subunit
MTTKLTEVVEGVKLVKTCSIKPDKDSDESKQVNLEVTFDGVSLEGVFQKALSSTVIQWQNGPGRKQFDLWKDGQTVKVQFNAPGRVQVDPETAMVAKLQSMTPEEQQAYLQSLMAKAGK